jgi:muramoyltetrapeptide carboxypeptidase
LKRASGKPASIVPPAPQPGDTIGVIAPASNVSKDALEKGCARLREADYKVFFFESILERDLYFAGSHERRAWELQQMFQKPFVKGILCARGGYGTNHLLPLIDTAVVRDHPKFFMGYSDVTTLLTWFTDQCDLVTYHGPMVAKDFADEAAGVVSLQASGFNIHHRTDFPQISTGAAEGVLYGGCLSMLAASLSTPYEIETKGTILFMEDIAVKPFQVDRMLMQLRYAGKFDEVRGIIFGEMVDCTQPGGQDYTLTEVIQRTLTGIQVPIGFGLPSGHVSRQPNLTLPIGMKVRAEISNNEIAIVSA